MWKNATLLIGAVLIFAIIGFAGFGIADHETSTEKDMEEPKSICPVTKISDNDKCLNCHVAPDFGLKEGNPERYLDLPAGTKIIDGKPYFKIEGIFSDYIQDFFNYVYWHPEYRHVVLEIHSPGGSLLDAWKIIGLMDQAKKRGIVVETRCYGFAASAGFIIFINGDFDFRYVNKTAEFMWHELWSLSFLKLETPSKKEDEAKVMRHLQDTVHNWLITRCTKSITKEEVDAWVRHKDYWLNGADMITMGFAEGEPK